MPEKIRITSDDLYRTSVDEIVKEQQVLDLTAASISPTSFWRRLIFNSLFFLATAGAIGGLIGWLIMEPHLNESVVFAGTIEYTELAMAGDTQGRFLTVRGQSIFVNDQVTRIDSDDRYAGVERVGDLTIGHPVIVTSLILSEDEIALVGTRVKVADFPPELGHEPLPDFEAVSGATFLSGIFAFAIVGACIAGLIAAADAIVSRNFNRGLLCAVCGIGIAAVGGLIGLIPAGAAFSITLMVVNRLSDGVWTTESLKGLAFLWLILGRSLTWGVFGITVGLGQGVALRSRQLVMNGLLGGVLGGLVGGALFDPIDKLFSAAGFSAQAMASRGIGFVVIGLSTGLMIGFVELLSKDSWLLMRKGPLAGKEFIIHKSPIVLGSSPKCDIYLFKDAEVDPNHAQIRKVGDRHEIIDLGSRNGTRINGQMVQRATLQNGDHVIIGQTVLEFAERKPSHV